VDELNQLGLPTPLAKSARGILRQNPL
jgi:hypothetical protein